MFRFGAGKPFIQQEICVQVFNYRSSQDDMMKKVCGMMTFDMICITTKSTPKTSGVLFVCFEMGHRRDTLALDIQQRTTKNVSGWHYTYHEARTGRVDRSTSGVPYKWGDYHGYREIIGVPTNLERYLSRNTASFFGTFLNTKYRQHRRSIHWYTCLLFQ